MLAAARKFADRVGAVEGCNGIGRHLAHRLVHDGEVVALVALRAPGLVQVQVEEDLVVMGMLADRRDELGRARTQVAGRLHRLLLELRPGGAEKFLSARQARARIAVVRPRDLAGKTRCRAGRRAGDDRQEDAGPRPGTHPAGPSDKPRPGPATPQPQPAQSRALT